MSPTSLLYMPIELLRDAQLAQDALNHRHVHESASADAASSWSALLCICMLALMSGPWPLD